MHNNNMNLLSLAECYKSYVISTVNKRWWWW